MRALFSAGIVGLMMVLAGRFEPKVKVGTGHAEAPPPAPGDRAEGVVTGASGDHGGNRPSGPSEP